MVQESGEAMGDFVIRLETAAQTCKFCDYLDGDETAFQINALQDALIDRFIAGLSNDRI